MDLNFLELSIRLELGTQDLAASLVVDALSNQLIKPSKDASH